MVFIPRWWFHFNIRRYVFFIALCISVFAVPQGESLEYFLFLSLRCRRDGGEVPAEPPTLLNKKRMREKRRGEKKSKSRSAIVTSWNQEDSNQQALTGTSLHGEMPPVGRRVGGGTVVSCGPFLFLNSSFPCLLRCCARRELGASGRGRDVG